MSDVETTHHDLWGGVTLKLDNATFHLEGMVRALHTPERNPHMAVNMGDMGGDWHVAFYAHLDAFLSAARSMPEVIRCCFGEDDRGPKDIRKWFESLDKDEQNRRREFTRRFKSDYDAFRALPLGTARHISEHRTGSPPVIAVVTGLLGITYVGSPTKCIPTSETRKLPDGYGWMERPIALRTYWKDFTIDGQPLHEALRNYRSHASTLIDKARVIAEDVHHKKKLTCPPTEL
jgi:hypothetical protein